MESRTEVDREVFENVRLRSSLNLFASFNQTFTETRLPDVLWENLITMEVNAWLGVDFEFVTLYDRDLSQRLQLKEVLRADGLVCDFVSFQRSAFSGQLSGDGRPWR